MPVDIPVVTGYYRYTDIWFEWCVRSFFFQDCHLGATADAHLLGIKPCPTSTIGHRSKQSYVHNNTIWWLVKTDLCSSFQAHDALVHPDHPLHVDGIKGVQMYMGMPSNIFSSGRSNCGKLRHFPNWRSTSLVFISPSWLSSILASCDEIDERNRTTALLWLSLDGIQPRNCLPGRIPWWRVSAQCDQG